MTLDEIEADITATVVLGFTDPTGHGSIYTLIRSGGIISSGIVEI